MVLFREQVVLSEGGWSPDRGADRDITHDTVETIAEPGDLVGDAQAGGYQFCGGRSVIGLLAHLLPETGRTIRSFLRTLVVVEYVREGGDGDECDQQTDGDCLYPGWVSVA